MRFMVDTNIFNWIVEGKFERSSLPEGARLCVTHVQRDELAATPDNYRSKRDLLLSLYTEMVTQAAPTSSAVCGFSRVGNCQIGGVSLPTESMVWDVSSWDEGKWPSGESNTYYGRILAELEMLDSDPDRKNSHIRDALIAETAIANDATLLTADGNLAEVMRSLSKNVNLVAPLGKSS